MWSISKSVMLISSHLNKQRLTSDQEDKFDRNFLHLQNHAEFHSLYSQAIPNLEHQSPISLNIDESSRPSGNPT
ncbi:hypothetical protein H5410_047467 [Solanum commersonii]|uniref:Uncharacterized protein n=1 Tax=Solanum commersonii TaxID=4109 RepID=A0A9J5XF77_SOLCO|nr:hypothetical protein H5410_047467 [Solanum commersonii]